jgi:catechol 2,3-dioxygenase-like lactoylglutathione lyase family enzyme
MQDTSAPRFVMDHIGIVVPDLDAALAFYVDVLGMTVIKKDAGAGMPGENVGLHGKVVSLRLALLAAGGSNVEVIEYIEPRGVSPRVSSDEGLGHLAFTVDDIQSSVAYLKQHGVTFYTPVIEEESGRSWLYGEDPFGVVIELGHDAA